MNRWLVTRVGWVCGVLEIPLSFCLLKLFILTQDVPTPNVSSWNRTKHNKASLPGENSSEVLYSFFQRMTESLIRRFAWPNVRWWNRTKHRKASLLGENTSEVLFSLFFFFSKWRKAWLDASYETLTQNVSLRHLPLWYDNKELHSLCLLIHFIHTIIWLFNCMVTY